MAKIRNVTSDVLAVPALSGRTVAPDEVVEVADDLFTSLDWPESTWAVVTPPKKVAAPTKDEE